MQIRVYGAFAVQLSIHRPLQSLRAILPSAITVGAILAGYLAILEVVQGEYFTAARLILVACMLDMFDGRVARVMKSQSEFGVEFDSLADMVNYGVAPALLFYFMYFSDWGIAGTMLSFLPVCCAGIRLARFNAISDPDIPTRYYIGLPTTIGAVVMAGYAIFIDSLITTYDVSSAAAVLTVVVSLLMISEVQYEKSNILSIRYIRKTRRVITGVVILASLVLIPETAFFAWGLLYIIYGAARSAFYFIWYGRDDLTETETDELYEVGALPE
jgi:CDP-diacylglycerol--serine O-phosphatidyltransferase